MQLTRATPCALHALAHLAAHGEDGPWPTAGAAGASRDFPWPAGEG